MSANVWNGYLGTRAIDDEAPPVTCTALRYHTIDGVEHAEGETYDITTDVGTLSTLMACQFADFAGVPPANPEATGALAGSPGTWTPPGALPPASFATMSEITATPTTAWTTGQHMVLGDDSHASWDGTAWTASDAP